jgi:hypothetical protein
MIIDGVWTAFCARYKYLGTEICVLSQSLAELE